MAKTKTHYVCQNCGHQTTKWLGKCPSCSEWNTFEEELTTSSGTKQTSKSAKKFDSKPKPLTEVSHTTFNRFKVPDEELNRVLGGGIVPGSLILLGGQPGIGKSTLILQTALKSGLTTLYVSGEESKEQIKLRSIRLNLNGEQCHVLNETMVEHVVDVASELKPQFLVIDSIQTMSTEKLESAAGTISQIRECTAVLQAFSKSMNIPIVIIGHITKEGAIAGPKLLEHMVDTVLYFEGERNYAYRILRTHKNRFGSTDEIGIYEMAGEGLKIVENPSEMLLSQTEEDLSGSAIAAMVEGHRPMLIETQALVSTAVYGTPQRSATGFDLRRLNMLLAVLEKRCGYYFGKYDVFLNIAGGLRVTDTGIDLAIACALISSLVDQTLPSDFAFAGEIGLSGEIRGVHRIDRRIIEAEKLGFSTIFIPKRNLKNVDPAKFKIEIHGIGKLQKLRDMVFAGV
ncbi:MAG: DNA repair protein RadA [Saprospiraceae bacterium]|nr:DNA repair protein RadA [Saprospiraceae bacterium]